MAKWDSESDKKERKIGFFISGKLLDRIDEFAEKLTLVYIPPLMRNKGFRSVAIRLAIEDTMLRFFGPRDKDNEDEIFCPYYNEMSKIIPLIRQIKMVEALDKMPENISHNKEEIDKIIKKYG